MTNTVMNAKSQEVDFDAAVNLMDDEVRESLHDQGLYTDQDFFAAYAEAHEQKFGEPFAPWVGGAW